MTGGNLTAPAGGGAARGIALGGTSASSVTGSMIVTSSGAVALAMRSGARIAANTVEPADSRSLKVRSTGVAGNSTSIWSITLCSRLEYSTKVALALLKSARMSCRRS